MSLRSNPLAERDCRHSSCASPGRLLRHHFYAERAMTRARNVLFALMGIALMLQAPVRALNLNDTGTTDTEIKLGQTMPYSGPASAFGTMGRTEAAYFQKVNEAGGVRGRKITLLSLDDGYTPPKTVEQTRRLVEQEGVLAIYGSLGTAHNTAIHKYLNTKRVPQLFIA